MFKQCIISISTIIMIIIISISVTAFHFTAVALMRAGFLKAPDVTEADTILVFQVFSDMLWHTLTHINIYSVIIKEVSKQFLATEFPCISLAECLVFKDIRCTSGESFCHNQFIHCMFFCQIVFFCLFFMLHLKIWASIHKLIPCVSSVHRFTTWYYYIEDLFKTETSN